ncbi:MAG: thiamine pyrophosphate-binding protein, partial [Actinobacteria bacterium]|nr:thiamine pyrophosphate-binding protein [Actinomycetota bacterium]
MAQRCGHGGSVLARSLAAAGIEVAFGVPGIHALPLWDGAVEAQVRTVGMRTEISAGFAADGYARASGGAGVLFTTEGPGAVMGAAALVESRLSFVPVVNVVTQVAAPLMGSGRGALHELAAQSEILRSLCTWHAIARDADEIPELVAAALGAALSPPQGPVALEIPADVLAAATAAPVPTTIEPAVRLAPPELEGLTRAASVLAAAANPVVLAGGGVLRAGASSALVRIAELLDAPTVTTAMGKGAIPADHPLAAGSATGDGATRRLLVDADVVLAVGTELGALVTGNWSLAFAGTLVQVDVRREHLGRSYPDALGVHGDARLVLEALAATMPARTPGRGAERAVSVRREITDGLRAQDREAELSLLRTVREALPRDAIVAWDMTISGYAAMSHFPVFEPDTWLFALGSGTLGYAWPAALGAALARPGRSVLAVQGDGGASYSLAEILTAHQEGLDVSLLVVDDGGYGILRVVQEQTSGRRAGVDLARADLPALARA